jgi:4-amino-4-deoxy-L-arabinose transferase-like glycosyltransferase
VLLAAGVFKQTAPDDFSPRLMNDANSAYYLCFARNILRYPLATTGLINSHLVGPGAAPVFSGFKTTRYYADHPPLLVWLSAITLKLSGRVSVRAARWVSILSSLVLAFLLLWGSSQAAGWPGILVSFLAISAMPVFWTHGLVVNFEPLTCSLMVASVILFSKVIQTGGVFWKSCFYAVWGLALLADWPAYFLAAPFALFFLMGKKWKDLASISAFSIFVYLAINFYYGYRIADWSFPLHFFNSAFSQPAFANVAYHWGNWAFLSLNYARMNYTPGLMAIGVLYLYARLVGANNRTFDSFFLDRNDLIIFSMSFCAVLNLILFKPWAVNHSFWTYYLLPFLALAPLDLFRQFPVKWKNYGLSVLLIFLVLNAGTAVKNYRYLREVRKTDYSDYREAFSYLASTSTVLVAADETPYFGQGYTLRWYVDKPLISIPDFMTVPGMCMGKTILLLAPNASIHSQLLSGRTPLFQLGQLGIVYDLTNGRQDRKQNCADIHALLGSIKKT